MGYVGLDTYHLSDNDARASAKMALAQKIKRAHRKLDSSTSTLRLSTAQPTTTADCDQETQHQVCMYRLDIESLLPARNTKRYTIAPHLRCYDYAPTPVSNSACPKSRKTNLVHQNRAGDPGERSWSIWIFRTDSCLNAIRKHNR